MIKGTDCKTTFIRTYDLEDDAGCIKLTQEILGDVRCVVWDASLVLAKYLELQVKRNPNFFHNQQTLELGSGIGCVGIVAACLGANIIVTDLPDAVPQLQQNVDNNEELITKNSGFIKVQALDWMNNSLVDFPNIGIILLADCVYYEESIKPLVKTLIGLSTENTEIFLTQEDRSYSETQTKVWKQFRNEIEKHFKISFIPLNEQHEEFRSNDIMLMKLLQKV